MFAFLSHEQAAALDMCASGEHIERSNARERKAEFLKRFQIAREGRRVAGDVYDAFRGHGRDRVNGLCG
jgi:hypothetical protein